MDGDGHPQLAQAMPHGIELRVVDGEELPAPVAQIEAEALELLEAGGPETRSLLDLSDGLLGEVGTVPARVVEVHVLQESPGKVRVGEGLHLLELGRLVRGVGRGATAEVHRHADADGVEDADREPHVLGRGIDVRVQVDEAVRGAPGGCFGADVGRGHGRRSRRARRRGRRGGGRGGTDGRQRSGRRRVRGAGDESDNERREEEEDTHGASAYTQGPPVRRAGAARGRPDQRCGLVFAEAVGSAGSVFAGGVASPTTRGMRPR